MRKDWIHIVVLGLLVLAGCSREPLPDGITRVPVQLAVSLESPSHTKASVNYIQELANTARFRGVEDIRVIPFPNASAVTSDRTSLDRCQYLPNILSVKDSRAYTNNQYHQGLIENNHAHLYPEAFSILPEGTGSVLLYGKGPVSGANETQEQKHRNGSLMESEWEDLETIQAQDITFSPEPIFSGATLETANGMANILTAIAGAATYTQEYYYQRNQVWYSGQTAVTWNSDIEDAQLRILFDWFTNEGQLMTGAGSNLEYMLTELYRRLENYSSDDEDLVMHTVGGIEYPAVLVENEPETVFSRSYVYEALRDMLLNRITALVEEEEPRLADNGSHVFTFTDSDMHNYPSSLGLPEGSAVLRWNSLAFVPVSEGLDGIAPIDHFCYMPPLYYFVNTTLKTSTDHYIYEEYTSKRTWEQIVSAYRLGNVVTKNSHAVVLENPVQYANALLVATVKAATLALPDGDGGHAMASGQNFPITGIIIGSQFKQNFDFSPDGSGTEYYLYDNQISGVYLTAAVSEEFRTLVFPVPENHDVYFFLELRNDSKAAFTGAEGVILPGSKFYLAGKMDKSNDPEKPSVFMQDYYTTLNCTVTSLENAHVSVPEMGEPQLTIGVQTSLNWIMSASAYVVLE